MRASISKLPGTPEHVVLRAVSILASRSEVDDEVIESLRDLTGDEMQAKRLIAWVPETLGHVYLRGLGLDPLPSTFGVSNARGRSIDLPNNLEPLYQQIKELAARVPTDQMEVLARRSSAYAATMALVKDGGRISDCVLTGPKLVSIPAETYDKSTGLLGRLLGW